MAVQLGFDLGLPEFSFSTPPYPSLSDAQNFYSSTLNQLRDAGEGMVASLSSSAISSIAGAATLVGGPVGPLVAFGGSILGSIFKGIFGGGNPPVEHYKIAGESIDKWKDPLENPDRALVAGQILGDPTGIEAKAEVVDSINKNAGEDLRNELGRMRRREESSARWRSVAYFCTACPYEILFGEISRSDELRRHIGKLLAWGAPRVRLRRVFERYWLYEVAKAYDHIYGEGKCSKGPSKAEGEWKIICQTGKTMYQEGLTSTVIAPPYQKMGGKVWVYSPWDAETVKKELDRFYKPDGYFETRVGKYRVKVKFNSWSDALRQAIALAKTDTEAMEDWKDGVAEMNVAKRPRDIISVSAKALTQPRRGLVVIAPAKESRDIISAPAKISSPMLRQRQIGQKKALMQSRRGLADAKHILRGELTAGQKWGVGLAALAVGSGSYWLAKRKR
jgi:hypothetical protein